MRAGEDTVKKSDDKLLSVVRELTIGLGKEVYGEDVRAVIEATRPVLDLSGLAIKLKDPEGNFIKVAATEFPKFKKAVDAVPITSLQPVPVEELRRQYRVFLEGLSQMTSKLGKEELKGMDSKEIIKNFFDPAGKEFVDIEMVMQAIAVCSVKHSCESVLESFVSRYENHFDSRRSTDEETSNQEFEIAVNGPSLAHCDTVVREAMDDNWRRKAKD